jgi:peroxiredoxin Q/BCP
LSRLQAKAGDANNTKADSHPKESAKSSVTVGSVLPDLILKNEKGDDIQVADLAKETGVIIFAFPKVETGEFLFMLNILYCTIYVDGPIF